MLPLDNPSPRQFPPTSTGIVKPDPDWTVLPSVPGDPFIAYQITAPIGGQIGQMLGFLPGTNQPNWAARLEQDGYRWSVTPFPDQFKMTPLPNGHASNISQPATWYQQDWFAAVGAPAQPGPADTIWKIIHKPVVPPFTEREIGFLIRPLGGASMRWALRSSEIAAENGRRGLPRGELKFARIDSTDFPDGPYEEAVEQKVP